MESVGRWRHELSLKNASAFTPVPCDQRIYGQEERARVIEEARIPLHQCQLSEVTFWPRHMVEILGEFGMENRKLVSGCRAAWMIEDEEYQAAFMQARLPRER